MWNLYVNRLLITLFLSLKPIPKAWSDQFFQKTLYLVLGYLTYGS
jgi:hypothetical protein